MEIIMFKIVGLLVVVAIAAFLVYVAMKPSDFRITRSQSIKAAPEAVFAYINDLHGFNSWNPFAQGDPALKIDYSGPRSGKGAAYVWDSTGKTGKGRMEPHKLMGTIFNMDKMVGGEFEKGLVSLKALAERQRPVGT
jgi:hypothetical protein